ncbi:MAG: response regulator [Deltaproteobacteria bacterium]|nr:response regulator [Deltaproteobacteria bacterium]
MINFSYKNKSRTKILIINDNAAELASLVAGLEAEGFQISGTTDPSSALESLSQIKFDVALIDLMISKVNGLQLARDIRSSFPSVNTMLMSDYLLGPVQLAKADTGVIGFIPKPCNYKEVAGFIKEKTKNLNLSLDLKEEKSTSCKSSSSTSKVTPLSTTPFDVLTVRYTC